jgi:hypothetical protein
MAFAEMTTMSDMTTDPGALLRRVERLERRSRWLWAALTAVLLITLVLSWAVWVTHQSSFDKQHHITRAIHQRLEKLEERR